MRDRLPEIRSRDASLVLIGNGSPSFAEAFREDLSLAGDVALLVDPELRSYRAAGMRRGYAEVVSPRLATNAWRALRGGYRQRSVQGDPFQLGGVLVIRAGGDVVFRHVSQVAGDHASLDDVLEALAPDARPLSPAREVPPLLKWGGEALSKVLDPTIVLSFDRTGFARHALGFDSADLERDLTGRRAIVTGANSGIGFATALALADLGAEVVLACRNESRGEAAALSIREQTGNRRVAFDRLDVSSLVDVRAFASRRASERVDILVHNAGILPNERITTPEGFEACFATHVAGPHLLTGLLAPALARSDDARVVWVSSGGMYTRKLDLLDLQWEKRRYDGVLAYAQTKRMQVVLAAIWAERAGRGHPDGSSPCFTSMHPGWADTPSVASALPKFHRMTEAVLRSPTEGADTVVWLAVAPREKLEPGSFYFDRKPQSPHLLPWTRESAAEREEFVRLVERCIAGDSPTTAGDASAHL